MTRFARAKGSKASNERLPEKATPWSVMKEEMQKKQQESEENKAREKLNVVRQQNYDDFLKQQTSEVTTEWADFSDDDNKSKGKNSKNIEKPVKSKSKSKKDKLISKREIMEMLKPDAEVDAKLEKITSQIVQILDLKELKKNKGSNNTSNENVEMETQVVRMKKDKKLKHKKENLDNDQVGISTKSQYSELDVKAKKDKKHLKVKPENDDSIMDSNSAPVEISAKIEPSEIVISKKKKKKTSLKIESVSKQMENIEPLHPLNDTISKKKKKKPILQEEPINKQKEEENNSTPVEHPSGTNETQMTKSMKKRLKKNKRIENKNKYEQTSKKEEINGNINKKSNVKNNNDRKPQEDNANKRKHPINENENERPNKFPRKEQIQKVAKVRDDKEHKRRKPDEGVQKMIFNGNEVEIVKFDGFPVKKEDADRLKELRKQMISKGIPRSEVKRSLLLERRKAEKSLSREKKKVCFQCRKAGHMLSECPELNSNQISFSGCGICFKCGSTEHSHLECRVTRGDDYKFASCFICKEQGHIARQCPDNPKGLYPEGGACKLCGDVTHLKKDCPQTMKEKEDNTMFLKTISGDNIESIDDDLTVNKSPTKPISAKNKIVKF